MLGDLSENAAITLTFNSVNCNYPCHECLVEGRNLNNVKLTEDQIILRTPDTMKAFVEQCVAQEYSLHVFIFIIEGLIIKYHKEVISANRAKRKDEALTSVYYFWNKMYLYSRREYFLESKLDNFEA
jgi:hypothetical protein